MSESTGSKAMTRILQALRQTPGLSPAEIGKRAYVGENTLSGGGYLKQLKDAGQIHISGWRRNGSGAFTTPLYSAGQARDCERPRITVENRQAPGMARLLAAIRSYGPIDYAEAATIAELSRHTAKNAGYLKALSAQGKIHIAGWRHATNGPMRPVYAFGPGPDVPRPARRSPADKLRLYRLTNKAAAGLIALQVQIILGKIKVPVA